MARKHFRAEIYVDAYGRQVGARDTVAPIPGAKEARTYLGRPVEYAGDSYTVARKYARGQVVDAQRRALRRHAAWICSEAFRQRRLEFGYSPEECPALPESAGPFLRAVDVAENLSAALGIFGDWLEEQGDWRTPFMRDLFVASVDVAAPMKE